MVLLDISIAVFSHIQIDCIFTSSAAMVSKGGHGHGIV
jgi:hypothetical protein